MERLVRGLAIFKLRFPVPLKINRINKSHARGRIGSARLKDHWNHVIRLICDPLIDVRARLIGIAHKIRLMKLSRVIALKQTDIRRIEVKPLLEPHGIPNVELKERLAVLLRFRKKLPPQL